jgi:outer membrane protein assembly factor BamD
MHSEVKNWRRWAVSSVAVVVLIALGATSCGFRRKAYENPITKDTQQPDKILYDKAVKDI